MKNPHSHYFQKYKSYSLEEISKEKGNSEIKLGKAIEEYQAESGNWESQTEAYKKLLDTQAECASIDMVYMMKLEIENEELKREIRRLREGK